MQDSHRRIIHSSRPPHIFTPFHTLSLDPFQFCPQAFQLALEPLALLLGISNLLRDSELPSVQFYDLCSMLCAAVVRDDPPHRRGGRLPQERAPGDRGDPRPGNAEAARLLHARNARGGGSRGATRLRRSRRRQSPRHRACSRCSRNACIGSGEAMHRCAPSCQARSRCSCHLTRMPGVAPESADSANISLPPGPAANIMPSEIPKRIFRGSKFATTTMSRPTRVAGS